MIEACGLGNLLKAPALLTVAVELRHAVVQGAPKYTKAELSPLAGAASIYAVMLATPAPRAEVAMFPPAPEQAGQPGPSDCEFGSVIGFLSKATPAKVNLLFSWRWVMAVPSIGLAMKTTGSLGNNSVCCACTRTVSVLCQVPLPGEWM